MIPESIGKYKIIDLLGVGAMGKVYKGFDPKMGRFVAIKVMAEKYVTDEEIKKRFYKEAIAPAKLFHPNIVNIYDLDEAEGKPFIVMEFLDGVDLKQIKKIGINFSIPQVVNIILQVARGLAHAHSAGIVHRDIKPANLILLKNGTMKIVDFGIAKLFESTVLTHTGMAIGTPAYMSPEQAKGKKVDIRTDQFSLGIVAYELLTGRNPFLANNYTAIIYKILNEDPPKLSYLVPNCPEELSNIVERMLKKDASERYPNLFEATKDLEKLIQNYSESEIKLSELQTFFEKTQAPSTFSNQKIFKVKQLIKNSQFDSASEILSSIEEEADPILLEALKKELEKSLFEKKINKFLDEIKKLEEENNFQEARKKIEDKINEVGEMPILKKRLLEVIDKEKKYIENVKIAPALNKSSRLIEDGKYEEALKILKEALQFDESNIEVQKKIIQLERKIAKIHSLKNNENYILELIKEREYISAFKNIESLLKEFPDSSERKISLENIEKHLIENFIGIITENVENENYSKAKKEVELLLSPQNREHLLDSIRENLQKEIINYSKSILVETHIYFTKFLIEKSIEFFGESEELKVLREKVKDLIKEIEEKIKAEELVGDELSKRVQTIRELIKKGEFEVALEKLNEAQEKFEGAKPLEDLSIQLEEKVKERERLQKIESLKREFEFSIESGDFEKGEKILKELDGQIDREEFLILENKLAKYREKHEKENRLKNTLSTIKDLEKRGDLTAALNLVEKALEEFPESYELMDIKNILKREIEIVERNREIEKLAQEISFLIKEEEFKKAEKLLEKLKDISPNSSKTIEVETSLLDNRKEFISKFEGMVERLIEEENIEEAKNKLNFAIEKCGENHFKEIAQKIRLSEEIFEKAKTVKEYLEKGEYDLALMHGEVLSRNYPTSTIAKKLYEKVISERNKFIEGVLQEATIHEKSENFSVAIEILKKGLECVPNSLELKDKLEKIEKKRSEKIEKEGLSNKERELLKRELDEVLKSVDKYKDDRNYLEALRLLEGSKLKYPFFQDIIEKKINEIQGELEKELETGRKISKKVISLVVVLILIIIVGIGYLILRPTPPAKLPNAHIQIDFKPWAKVEKIVNLKDGKVISKVERITPFSLSLKPGKYKIFYKYPSPWNKSCEKTIELKPGKTVILKDAPKDMEEKIKGLLNNIIEKNKNQ